MSACNTRFDLWSKAPPAHDDAKRLRAEKARKDETAEGIVDDENSSHERRIDQLNDAVRHSIVTTMCHPTKGGSRADFAGGRHHRRMA